MFSLPVRPDESDCCGSGCNPCIFDVYERQLKLYFTKKSSEDKSTTTKFNNCLSQTTYSVFQVTDITKDTEDTNLYTFKFLRKCREKNEDCGNLKLIFTPSQYCFLKGKEKKSDKFVSKPFTVLHNKKDDMSFKVLIKIWPNSSLTHYLENLEIGEETEWRGPFGDYNLNFKLNHVLMIAQGTGIAPLYSIIDQIVDKEDCETNIKLLFCCKDHNNIHLRRELYKLSSNWNFTYDIFLGEEQNLKRFNKLYRENILVQQLTEKEIKEYLKNKNCEENYAVLICGSINFEKSMEDLCTKCGIQKKFIHIF